MSTLPPPHYQEFAPKLSWVLCGGGGGGSFEDTVYFLLNNLIDSCYRQYTACILNSFIKICTRNKISQSWARDNFFASRQRKKAFATTRQILASGSRDNVFRNNATATTIF